MKTIMVAIGGKDIQVAYRSATVKAAIRYQADIFDPAVQAMIGQTVSFLYNPDFNPQWSWPVPTGAGIDAYRMLGEVVAAVRHHEETSVPSASTFPRTLQPGEAD